MLHELSLYESVKYIQHSTLNGNTSLDCVFHIVPTWWTWGKDLVFCLMTSLLKENSSCGNRRGFQRDLLGDFCISVCALMCILGHLLSILFILSCLFNLGKMNIVVYYVIQCRWWYLCPLFNFVARQSIRETRLLVPQSKWLYGTRTLFIFTSTPGPKIQAWPHRAEKLKALGSGSRCTSWCEMFFFSVHGCDILSTCERKVKIHSFTTGIAISPSRHGTGC